MKRGALLVFICFTLAYGNPDKFPENLNLPRCALKDQECMRSVYEGVVQRIGEKGIPEVGIPPVDPIELRDVTVSVLNLLNITMIKGVATGVRTCVFDKFFLNLKKESGYQENTCSLKIEGKYKARSDSPLINELLGRKGSFHGDGNAKTSIDKVHLTYDFPIYAQIRPDGEIYMKCDWKRVIYNFEVLGGAKFWADHIYSGDQDISKEILPLLNQNWRFVLTSFGKPFIDKAMEFYFDFAGKFFDVVPARYFILDDLTPYARP